MNTSGIIYQQRKWAATRGIRLAKGYTPTLEDNLFQSLNAETRADFAAGGGNEVGGAGSPGKMQRINSSSALVCNVFDYWRSQLLLGQSLETLTTALGAPHSIKQMQFEQIYPTGIRDTPPQFDIVLLGDNSKPFLIEFETSLELIMGTQSKAQNHISPTVGNSGESMGCPGARN